MIYRWGPLLLGVDLPLKWQEFMLIGHSWCLVQHEALVEFQTFFCNLGKWKFMPYKIEYYWLTCELLQLMSRLSSSVGRAHFVTALSIDLKLCTYVPLGEMTLDQISVRSDSWPWDQKQKCIQCYNSWPNRWIISKFLSWVHIQY
jgi:hypothetical protein